MSDSRPVTLGELIEKDELLWIFCRACCREVEIAASAFPHPLPSDFPVYKIAPLLRCTCGARQTSIAAPNGEVGVIYERMALRGYGLPARVGRHEPPRRRWGVLKIKIGPDGKRSMVKRVPNLGS